MSSESFCSHRCAVYGCSSRSGHPLPENAELRQKWIDVLALEDCKRRPNDTSFVCNNHFRAMDYNAWSIDSDTGGLNLKDDAIPSACLFESDAATLKRKRYSNGGVHGAEALFQSACRKCNYDAEQCLRCIKCQRHFHVRCAGRAPVVMLGFDYLTCCKQNDSSNDPSRQCSVGSDELADVPEAEIISVESDDSESVTELILAGDNFGTNSAEETAKVVVISSEWLSTTHSNYSSIASSTGEEFVIPVEEVIIKEEPVDENLDHSLDVIEVAEPTKIEHSLDGNERFEFPILCDTILENVQPVPKRVNDTISTTNECRAGVGSLPNKNYDNFSTIKSENTSNDSKKLIVKNCTAKRTFREFSYEDMDNPQEAAKFYLLAQELLKANLLLSDQNYKMELEIKRLKKKIENGGVDVCARCTRMQRRLYSDPNLKNTNDGSLKRNEPMETVSIIMKREPARDATVQKTKAMFVSNNGPYRIAALEHFVNAISDMQCDHVLQCPGKCKMKIHSETLSGISGEWMFRCGRCSMVKTVPTEPDYRGTLSETLNPWLNWLGSLPQRHLGFAHTVFEKLNVPFLYNFTPTTLKVGVRKRKVFNPE